MKRSESFFGLLRVPLDSLAVAAALLLSFMLREANIDLIPQVQLLEPPLTLPPVDFYITDFVFPGIGIFLVIASVLKMYAFESTVSAWREIRQIIIAALLWVVTVMAWYFLIRKQLFFSRILLVHSAFFITFFVALARSAVVILQRSMMRWGIGVHQVVTFGKQPVAITAKAVLENDRRYAYLGHMKDLTALKRLQSRKHIDLALQTDASPQSEETIELINHCRSAHIDYAFLPPVFADVPHQLVVERLGLLPLLQFKPTPLDGWGRILKRFFDIVVSAFLIVILSPLLVIIALAILIESGFPIVYVSRRTGERGKADIPVLKFRSMVKNADAKKKDLQQMNARKDGPLFKLKNDPRITPLGRTLRRFDLDELPQLFNVLLGHMSLVGPRPHLPEEVDRYTSYQRRVFAVKPGITGLAQISGRSNLAFDEEVRFDLQYVEEWSPLLDLWILWRTIFVVVERY